MTSLHTSRPGAGEDPGRAPAEYGVLLWSGLVCPAASKTVAVEQARRLGGIACQTGGEPT